MFVDNLGRFVRGEALRNLVDTEPASGSDGRSMAERVIEIVGLHKSYGDLEAVAGIDLHVDRGEVFALLGPNGAGKTTTTEILEGYLAPTAGSTSVLGHDPAKGEQDLKRRIGIVLQSTGVDKFLTVRETIEMYGGYYPRQRPTEEVIEVVGLSEKTDAPCPAAQRRAAASPRRRDRARRRSGAPVPRRADDARGDGTARRMDINADVLLGILGLEKKKLSDRQIRHEVVDRRADKNDSVLQETRINVVGPFAPARRFDNHRHQNTHRASSFVIMIWRLL